MHMPIQDNVYLMKWNSSLGAYQLQIFVMAKSYMIGQRFVAKYIQPFYLDFFVDLLALVSSHLLVFLGEIPKMG